MHRDPIPYNRPGHFWGHHNHYFGYRVHHLPPHYDTFYCWGRPYYVYDNIYYRPWGSTYVVCRPPYGVFFHPTLLDVALDAVVFSYYCDTYRTYRTIDENWETINEQNAVIARNNATLAAQNAAIAAREADYAAHNNALASNAAMSDESYRLATALGLVQSYADANVQYYYQDGVFFVMDAKGEYRVIVPPAGAVVESLPEDYEIITFEGVQYYKVDDTIYRTVVMNGKACFEVLGQQM